MHETLRQIRNRLRLSMNGVVSTSMREKGLEYKLNFGVSLPQIKIIAKDFSPGSELAGVLWQQEVREMKILATLLQPVSEFTQEMAQQWAIETPNQEIAELYVMNLLQHLPFAEELAFQWILSEKELIPILGFILYARLFMRGTTIHQENISTLLDKAKKAIESNLFNKQKAALLMFKQYGKQSPQQGKIILDFLSDYKDSHIPERMEWYTDLKFEFDYYK